MTNFQYGGVRFHMGLIYGRLAQLDRALASEAKGRGFDSRTAHHLNQIFNSLLRIGPRNALGKPA